MSPSLFELHLQRVAELSEAISFHQEVLFCCSVSQRQMPLYEMASRDLAYVKYPLQEVLNDCWQWLRFGEPINVDRNKSGLFEGGHAPPSELATDLMRGEPINNVFFTREHILRRNPQTIMWIAEIAINQLDALLDDLFFEIEDTKAAEELIYSHPLMKLEMDRQVSVLRSFAPKGTLDIDQFELGAQSQSIIEGFRYEYGSALKKV